MKDRFREVSNQAAIVTDNGDEYSYQQLLEDIEKNNKILDEKEIKPGSVIALRSDFNPRSVSWLLTLIERNCIIVPISLAVTTVEDFYEVAEVEVVIDLTGSEDDLRMIEQDDHHEFYLKLKNKNSPGLVLFSSGSTGKPKAAVHDFSKLLDKFRVESKPFRTITFLLFDHIGGVNSLFYILANKGTVYALTNRSPDNVCRMIERHKVELLPTSPSFINLIMLSRSYERYDLSSLKLVTYGTETMPEQTLIAFHKIFPQIRLKQTYGLSELGIMRSKSRSDDSLWVKVGGEGFETKIKDDILYIKAESAMLGYLNAPQPFDSEGWFNTQDKVVQDGEWIKILGRVSDIINVAGQKVYPAEVESVLLEIPEISDATVFSQDNNLLGKVVAAKVVLNNDMSEKELKRLIRRHCKDKLESFKVPVHVEIASQSQVSSRFKKMRNNA